MLSQTPVLLFGAGISGLAAIAILRAMFLAVEPRATAIVQRVGQFAPGAGPVLRHKTLFLDIRGSWRDPSKTTRRRAFLPNPAAEALVRHRPSLL